jgi:hypothetical protein
VPLSVKHVERMLHAASLWHECWRYCSSNARWLHLRALRFLTVLSLITEIGAEPEGLTHICTHRGNTKRTPLSMALPRTQLVRDNHLPSFQRF